MRANFLLCVGTGTLWALGGMASVTAAVPQPASQGTPQPSQSASDQKPAFRAGTERIVIDAAVVDEDGGPVTGLTADDFTLTIDGSPRRLLSAEFVSQNTADATGQQAPTRRVGYSTNETTVGGRLVMLAFDLEGIAAGGGREAAQAAREFVRQLDPSDQVGVLSFPNGINVEFTGDRARVAAALEKIVGRGTQLPPSTYNLGIQEAFDIEAGNTFALQRAIERECPPLPAAVEARPTKDDQAEVPETCPLEVSRLARDIATTYRQRVDDVSRIFRTLLDQLKPIDAPKTVVWVSEGLAMPLDSQADIGQLSALAAAARVTLYAVHLDRNTGFDAVTARPSLSFAEDRGAGLRGLDLIAGVSRGAVFSSIGTGENAFKRIAREMTAYYLLSAEPESRDRDGRSHRIKVTLSRPGLTVRARRDFAVPAIRSAEPLTPEQAVASVLGAPLPATELPLKVATYSMRASQDSRLRLVISTEVGNDARAPDRVAIGFTVTDAKGTVIRTGFREATMTQVRSGEPGPLESTGGADIEPGSYTLKLAVVDSHGRRASVEHPFTAGLTRVGTIDLTDLVLTPAATKEQAAVRMSAHPTIDGQPFAGYLELFGNFDVKQPPTVAIEVADSDAGPPLGVQQGRITSTSDKERFIVEAPLPVGLLPPGDYVARALVTLGSATGRIIRPFTLARAVAADDVFKADLERQVGVFHAEQILTTPLLGRALHNATEMSENASREATAAATTIASGALAPLENLAIPASDSSLLASFLRGLSLYRKGSLEAAAKEFRASVRASPDFLEGILFLGACYASGGRTKEAVGAWQTSLIGDDAFPEIFTLVADGYLRMGDADAAAEILVEAGTKWPEDDRFTLRSALARAAAGRPDEALTKLMPAVERTDDPEILTLAVRLAIADVARRPTAEQPDRLPQLQDLRARLRAGKGEAPPALGRWITYLESRPH